MGLNCANLYDSLFIENDGYIYPCFRTTSKLGSSVIKHDDVAEHIDQIPPSRILESNGHVTMRQLMASGSWPNPCSTCRLAEARGTKSHRRDEDNTNVILKHIHVRVGNKCNLRCVMCGPGSSNQWYDLYPEITGQTNFDVSDFTYNLRPTKNGHALDSDNFNFSEHDKIVEIVEHHSETLESITFHGGEPFLSKSHNRIIQSLAKNNRANDISLSYHTNLTIIPVVLNDLKKFKSVNITISLDGIGIVNDAVRWPSKYDQIIKNYDSLRTNTDFNFSVNHTLSALNYEHLPAFMGEMKNMNLPVTLNPVHNPIYASASIYDDRQRSALMDRISTACDVNLIRGPLLANHSNSMIKQHRSMFNRMWDVLSKKQEQDWESIFPFAAAERMKWN